MLADLMMTLIFPGLFYQNKPLRNQRNPSTSAIKKVSQMLSDLLMTLIIFYFSVLSVPPLCALWLKPAPINFKILNILISKIYIEVRYAAYN
jgi:hypothetical protein